MAAGSGEDLLGNRALVVAHPFGRPFEAPVTTTQTFVSGPSFVPQPFGSSTSFTTGPCAPPPGFFTALGAPLQGAPLQGAPLQGAPPQRLPPLQGVPPGSFAPQPFAAAAPGSLLLPGDLGNRIGPPPPMPAIVPRHAPDLLMVYNEQRNYINPDEMRSRAGADEDVQEEYYDVPQRIEWIRQAVDYLRSQLQVRVVEWDALSHNTADLRLSENLMDLKLTLGMPQATPQAALVPSATGPNTDLPDRSHPEAAFTSLWACLTGFDDKAQYITRLLQLRPQLEQQPQGELELRRVQAEVMKPVVFAAVRPPGHHALYAPSGARGFCFFPNAAVLATRAIRKYNARVFILDIDFHYGLGSDIITQLINFAFQSAQYGVPPPADADLPACSTELPLATAVDTVGRRNVYRAFCHIFNAARQRYPADPTNEPLEDNPVAYMSYHSDSPLVYDSPLNARTTTEGLIHPSLLVDDAVARQRNVIRREASVWNDNPVAAAADLRAQLVGFLGGSLQNQATYIVVSAGFDSATTDSIGMTYDAAVRQEGNLWTRDTFRAIAAVLNEVLADPSLGSTGLVSILEGGYTEQSLKCSGVYSYLAELLGVPAAAIQDPVCSDLAVRAAENRARTTALASLPPPRKRRASSAVSSTGGGGRGRRRVSGSASSTRFRRAASAGAFPVGGESEGAELGRAPEQEEDVEEEEEQEVKETELEVQERLAQELQARREADRQRRRQAWVEIADLPPLPSTPVRARRRAQPVGLPFVRSSPISFTASTGLGSSSSSSPSSSSSSSSSFSSSSFSSSSFSSLSSSSSSSSSSLLGPRSPPRLVGSSGRAFDSAAQPFSLPSPSGQLSSPIARLRVTAIGRGNDNNAASASSSTAPETARRRPSRGTAGSTARSRAWNRAAEAAFQHSVAIGHEGYLTQDELDNIVRDFAVPGDELQLWLVQRIEQNR